MEGTSTATNSQLIKNTPKTINTTRGIVLAIVRKTAILAPFLTPRTFTQVRRPNEEVITSVLPHPSVAPGHRYPKANAKPTDKEATEVTRASQVIHPTSNPTK